MNFVISEELPEYWLELVERNKLRNNVLSKTYAPLIMFYKTSSLFFCIFIFFVFNKNFFNFRNDPENNKEVQPAVRQEKAQR